MAESDDSIVVDLSLSSPLASNVLTFFSETDVLLVARLVEMPESFSDVCSSFYVTWSATPSGFSDLFD